MAIDPNLRTKIEAELRMGKKPRELAEKYTEVAYPTINNWSKKIRKESEEREVDGLLSYDEVTLKHVVDEAKKVAPVPEAKKVEKLVDDAVGLKRLEEKSRGVAFTILSQVEAALALKSEPNMKMLKEAAGIVSTLHTALFNKNVTQVMVNNQTNISTERREIFKSSLGA
jgi:hypothetical protein